MTKLNASAVGVLLFMCSLSSFAQEHKLPVNEPDYSKPQLFADLPQKMNLKITAMDNLFQLAVGAVISVQVSDAFTFEGTVVSKSDAQDANVKSIVIRSSNRQGATFTITRTTDAGGSTSYIGRIMSTKNSDAYEIAMEKGQYVLQKRNLYDLISE